MPRDGPLCKSIYAHLSQVSDLAVRPIGQLVDILINSCLINNFLEVVGDLNKYGDMFMCKILKTNKPNGHPEQLPHASTHTSLPWLPRADAHVAA